MTFLLIVLASSYLLLFLNLGAYSLKEPDEGRYAEIPREMVEQGDYLVPHLNYVRYFEKPPLLYWITAASYKVFGVNEGSFRFPNALMALFCVLVIFFFVSRWFNAKSAFIASLILLTSFGFFAMARIVTTDMLFTFLLFASLSCFYEFYRERKRAFLYLFFIALALAVLVKGPAAIVLLGSTILLFLYSEKNLSFLKMLLSFKGLLVFAIIAAPWFVFMSFNEKGFARFFFVDQHLLRFVTTKHNRSGPIYYFVPVLLCGLFPWSIFIPRAVARFWRARETRLFLLWSAVVFVFFSISGSKLPPYILPVFPALAIVLALLFEGKWKEKVTPNYETLFWVIALLFVILGYSVVASGRVDGRLDRLPEVLFLLRDLRLLFFCIALLAVAGLVILSFPRLRTASSLLALLSIFSLVVVTGLMLEAHNWDNFRTTKKLAEIINGADKETIVVDYRSFEETLPFYLARRTYIAEYTGELQMGAQSPDSRAYFLSADQFVDLIRSGQPFFVVTKIKRLKQLSDLGLGKANIVACESGKCLLSNRKHLR